MPVSKRKLTYICLAVFFFMEGVEYAVILPTLWLYLQSKFQAKEWFFGLVLSAFSFSGLFAGPIMGNLSDKIGKSKFIIIFGMLFEIGGNFMYFVGKSKYFILGGRLIAGVGIGGDSVILAEIGRGTTEEERTGILSLLIAFRQIGLVIGPGFNLFLRLCNFHVGPFLVDKYTSPGAFMSLSWTFVTIMFLCLFHGLSVKETTKPVISKSSINSPYSSTTEDQNEQSNKRDTSDHNHQDGNIETSVESFSDILINQAENVINSTSSEDIYQEITRPRTNIAENHKPHQKTENQKALSGKSSKLLFFYNEFIKEEVVAVVAIQFNSIFNQIALQTMITPLTKEYLNWGELENSLMFCLAGVEVISFFILVRIISKRVKDRVLIFIGCCLLCSAVGFTMYVVVAANAGDTTSILPKMICGLLIYGAALPVLLISSVSLFTKLIRKEIQGLSQGLRRSVIGLGTILAPLWAGSTLSTPYVLFGVMLALLGVSFVMILLSYKRLVPLSETQSARISEAKRYSNDEKRKLLN